MSSKRLSFDPHAFCALPLVRRTYQALVVGLAVFLLTLVVLHEPFRGYLAEADVAGPPTEGLNLDDAVAWLKRADPRVAVVAIPAGEVSPKSRIRITYVSRRPAPAISHLDDLAQRWLYQYLPDRLQSYRRAVLADLRNAAQLARGQEDAAHERLEELRQVQLSQLVQTASNDAAPSPPPQPIASPAPSAATIAERERSREKLELLRLELSRLAANCTDQHPQVVTLRSQIAALERQLGAAEGEKPRAAETPVLMAPATSGQQSRIEPAAGTARRASHFVTVSAATSASPNAAADLAMQINAVAAQLAAASRQRQAAEHRLADRMQELSSQPTAAQWTARPAQAVTRLGGTPRSSTLALGGLLASVAGALAFRAARDSAMAGAIGSVAELERALPLPVVANMTALRAAANRLGNRWLTRRALQAVFYGSEGVVAIAASACLVAMLVEPSLARQVASDPFGTLSEVLERFTT